MSSSPTKDLQRFPKLIDELLQKKRACTAIFAVQALLSIALISFSSSFIQVLDVISY